MGALMATALRVMGCLVGGRCQLCAKPLPGGEHLPLCAECALLLPPRSGGYCPCCGMCYADTAGPTYLCLACRTAPPPWRALAFHNTYSGALKDLVHGHKFGHDHGLGRLLGYLARQTWDIHGLARPDIIVPVPMTPGKVVRRGFNQSVELAKMLGAFMSLPPHLHGLSKNRETMTQSSLGRAARHGNVAGAFAACVEMSGKHVLLVDDVMTTGATLAACAKSCRAAGATQVDAFVLARAL